MYKLGWSSVALALGLAGCAQAPMDVGAAEEPIINGAPESWPNVFKLYLPNSATTAAGCTATLIGTRTLLTAAHCVLGGTALPFAVAPGTNQRLTATSATASPDYVGSNTLDSSLHDAAVVVLALDVVNVEPAPLVTSAPYVGEAIHLVGYGLTDINASDYGTLRGGNNNISGVVSGYYSIAHTDATHAIICHGDSGGPDFVPTNVGQAVLGIHSRGTCNTHDSNGADTSYATSTRVDAALTFIRAAAGNNLYTTLGDYEKTPPTVTIDAPSTATSGQAFGATIHVVDDTRVSHLTIDIDGASQLDTGYDQPTVDYALDLTFTSGSHKITAIATDGAGQKTTAEAQVNVPSDDPDASETSTPDAGTAADADTVVDAAFSSTGADAAKGASLPLAPASHGCSAAPGSAGGGAITLFAIALALATRRRLAAELGA